MRQALVQVGVRCRESLLLYHRGRAHAHAFIAINIFGILLALDGGWSQTFLLVNMVRGWRTRGGERYGEITTGVSFVGTALRVHAGLSLCVEHDEHHCSSRLLTVTW